MKFITNTYDPRQRDAKSLTLNFGENPYQAWFYHIAWLRDKYIGEPVPANVPNATSREELIDSNMIGVYVDDGGEINLPTFEAYMLETHEDEQ